MKLPNSFIEAIKGNQRAVASFTFPIAASMGAYLASKKDSTIKKPLLAGGAVAGIPAGITILLDSNKVPGGLSVFREILPITGTYAAGGAASAAVGYSAVKHIKPMVEYVRSKFK
jgi:hypothetical protein